MEMTVEIPDDHWIDCDSDIRPKHRQLCLIMYYTGDQTVGIGVYINKPFKLGSHTDQGYFICVGDAWFENGAGCSDIQESFANWGILDKWKPLGLPIKDEKRIMQTTKEIYGYGPEDEAPWETKEINDAETTFKDRMAELIGSMSYQDFCDKANKEQIDGAAVLTKSFINEMITGTRQPKSQTLVKIAKAFDVSIDYLLGLTDTRHRFKEEKR